MDHRERFEIDPRSSDIRWKKSRRAYGHPRGGLSTVLGVENDRHGGGDGCGLSLTRKLGEAPGEKIEVPLARDRFA